VAIDGIRLRLYSTTYILNPRDMSWPRPIKLDFDLFTHPDESAPRYRRPFSAHRHFRCSATCSFLLFFCMSLSNNHHHHNPHLSYTIDDTTITPMLA